MLWNLFLLRKEEQFQLRIKILAIFMVSLLGLVSIRLAYLQILSGERYRELSARNRVRLVPIKAQRGLIYDRNYELLVGNVPSFNVSVVPVALPKDLAAQKEVFQRLQAILGVDAGSMMEKLQRRKFRDYEPIRLKGNIERPLATLIEERRPELPGIVVLTESRRHYKFNTLGFHVLGYVGEISEHELALREGYQAGDIVGQAGIEKAYDHYLRGRNGWVHIEVDALGRQMGILGYEDPWPGHSLILTMDRRLQERAEAILGERPGVIIVENVRNGEILALTSSPSFNPNNFAQGITPKEWEKLRGDRHYPLTNRGTQGLYPPGSIFKIITLMAALEEGLHSPNYPFYCKGIFWIATWPYRCWKTDGHGWVKASRSLIESCDVYYYQLGLRVKVDILGKWARLFGYGSLSGVDLPNERSGLVPSAQWKERTQNMPWFPGNTAMLSIGQGYILSTPMQILGTMVAVANRGIIYRPHLLREVRTKSGRLIHEVKPEIMHKVNASAQHWELIHKSLVGVIQNREGTGKLCRIPGMRLAGKTATAQNPHGEDHAAFVAYAPENQPEIAIVVYLENAGGGGSEAAPLARQVLEAYFGIPTTETLETK